MNEIADTHSAVQILLAARRVADFAHAKGMSADSHRPRACYVHLGAVLADSILQAGLNYDTVVRPRICRIFELFPTADKVGILIDIVQSGETSYFLDWVHYQKIARFNRIVLFVGENGISDTSDLREHLLRSNFCHHLRELNGVGPKTVDYMACLVGIESIAVDRHIKTFAKRVGVDRSEYNFLKHVFCAAADLLSVSRRDFDSWIWRHEAERKSTQMSFGF